MKKWKILLPILTLILACTGCGGDETEKDTEVENKIEAEQLEDEKSEDATVEEKKLYTLVSETEDIGIKIAISAEFQETDYISESWLAFEIPGKDADSSTQLMMYLEADRTINMKESLIEEVNYVMSANTDDWKPIEEIETISTESREWYYITYELDGLEGYKMWAELENETILAGTIENIGNNPKPVKIEEIIRQIDETIVVD